MEPKPPNDRELALMEAESAREAKRRAAELAVEIDENIGPVIDMRGEKHFAHLMGLGVEKQDRIYHWRERRNGQRPPGELVALVHEDPSPEGEKAMGDYCDARGFERPRRKLAADANRLAHALEDKLRRFGDEGERAIAEARIEAARAEPTPLRVAEKAS